MTPNPPIRLALALATMLGLGAAAPALGFESETVLSPAQEVPNPPVDSEARARGTITFDAGFTRARVSVTWRNLEGHFTRLHLHCAPAGQNGGIAIGLIDLVAPAFDNSDVISLVPGVAFGTLTNEEFPQAISCTGEPGAGGPINNLVSLAAAIDAGLVYWNLHTDEYPGGEVRGQVRPLKAD